MNITQSIRELFDFTFNNPVNELKRIDIGTIDTKKVLDISQKMGIYVKDFTISIDNFGIKHTISRHGNQETEDKHGQIAIEKEDFTKILEIINYADAVSTDAKKTTSQKDVLLFEKTMQSAKYVVAMEVREVSKKGKVSRLMFQSMRKLKNRSKP